MAKRNQINLTLDDAEMQNINEYCRTHGMTPQSFLKTGAQRLIQEDLLEHQADLMTMKALRDVDEGLSEPVDDLLEMIEEDKRIGNEMVDRANKPPQEPR